MGSAARFNCACANHIPPAPPKNKKKIEWFGPRSINRPPLRGLADGTLAGVAINRAPLRGLGPESQSIQRLENEPFFMFDFVFFEETKVFLTKSSPGMVPLL